MATKEEKCDVLMALLEGDLDDKTRDHYEAALERLAPGEYEFGQVDEVDDDE